MYHSTPYIISEPFINRKQPLYFPIVLPICPLSSTIILISLDVFLFLPSFRLSPLSFSPFFFLSRSLFRDWLHDNLNHSFRCLRESLNPFVNDLSSDSSGLYSFSVLFFWVFTIFISNLQINFFYWRFLIFVQGIIHSWVWLCDTTCTVTLRTRIAPSPSLCIPQTYCLTSCRFQTWV